jgi:transposase
MELSADQRNALEHLGRHEQRAQVRVKALALLSLADRRPVCDVARTFRVSRQTLYNWQRRHARDGIAGLGIRPGRGRKSAVDLEQVKDTVRRSPREFGIARTRWTLAAVAQAVPALAGYSARGVQKVLARAGLGYKLGQAWQHSPDPQYARKKGRLTRR